MSLPTTIADIDRLIADQVQESIHLDYKSSSAMIDSKFDELAKDVSAFANSDGGVLIYGVTEKDHLPTGKDGGVDHHKYNRERIEDILTSRISPRIEDVVIIQIPLSALTSFYGIKVPKSVRGPHQAPDKKYYKRYNFKSAPMEDYEITDIRNRRIVVPPLMDVRIQTHHRVVAYLAVTNIGEQTAEDISFDIPFELNDWIQKRQIKVFLRGIKYLPPKKTYTFFYGVLPNLLHEGRENPVEFDITVSYKHPQLEQRISETFHIDLMDHWGASSLPSDAYEQGKEIKDAVNKLTSEVNALNRTVSRIATIAGVTGLDLSITTIRNLKHLITNDEQFEKLNPEGLDIDAFIEILGVDFKTASHLRNFFWSNNRGRRLSEVPGLTEEIIERIQKHFLLEESE